MTQPPGARAPFAVLRRSAAATAGVVGLVVLLGWALDVALLKTGGLPGRATMKPNTALALVLGASALLLGERRAPWAQKAALAAASLVALVGALTLLEYASGASLGIDQLLFTDRVSPSLPGRMSLSTALCCVTLGLSDLLGLRGVVVPSQIFSLAAVAVAGLGVLGYAYNARQLYAVHAYATMAAHTAGAFLVLALATLMLHPREGLPTSLAGSDPVSSLGRRILIFAIVAPVVLSWLARWGERRGYYGPDFRLALLTAATIAVVGVGIALAVRHTARLDEERLRLARIVETTADAIITTDLEGTITSWNAAAERLYGFSGEEALGRSVDMIVPMERRVEIRDSMQRLAAGEQPRPFDTVRLRKQGAPVGIQVTISPIRSYSGAITGASAIARDVTERNESQRALLDASRFTEQIVRSTGEGIVVLDRDLRYVLWNPAMEQMSGLKAEAVLGRHPLDLFGYLRDSEAIRALTRALHGEVVKLDDVKAVHPTTKAPLWVTTYNTPLRSSSGEIQGVLVTVNDITERRQSEEVQRALARRVLSAHEEERGRVARELHDHVGQILTSVKIQLAGVARVKALDDVAPRAQAASEQVDMAIGQLRDLSRGLRPPQLDDLGLVPTLRWYAGQRSAESGVEIGLLEHLGDLRLGSDEEAACFRVVQEAITNALRHALPRKVMVGLERTDRAVTLSVSDDGVGFDLGSVGGRAAAGECLGLTSMRERVALCGGAFEVRSAPGQGTLVRAVIPIARPAAVPS